MTTVSAICSCKNRQKPLSISLSSWVLNKKIDEIIIIDWSSDEPIGHLAKIDERVKIVRVNNQQYFNQQMPLNLALFMASGEKILKMDSDYIMSPYYDFFDLYDIDSTSFVCGEPEDEGVKWNDYFLPLRGLMFCTKDNLNAVGGYNESLSNYYGFDDSEIEMRLCNSGLRKIKLKQDYSLIHIPHSDKERYENFKGTQEVISQIEHVISYVQNGGHGYSEEKEKRWQIQRLIAENSVKNNMKAVHKDVTKIENKTRWNIKKVDKQLYEASIA